MKAKTAAALMGTWTAFMLLAVLIAKLMDKAYPDSPHNLEFGLVASFFVFVVLAMFWAGVGPRIEPAFIRWRGSRKSRNADQ